MRKAKFDIVLSGLANTDLEEILAWSDREFGQAAAQRYEALLFQTFRDIAQDPARLGSHQHAEVSEDVRFYHLRFSRRVRDGEVAVREPRHFVVYFIARRGVIEIIRILHDSRDVARHLPQQFLD